MRNGRRNVTGRDLRRVAHSPHGNGARRRSARLLFDFVAGFIIAIFIYVASNPMVLDHMATGAMPGHRPTLENFRNSTPSDRPRFGHQ